jgi:Aldehyde dehydrogenase family
VRIGRQEASRTTDCAPKLGDSTRRHAHINDQTVDNEPTVPFGGVLDSGTGTRFGGTANLEAFTETRWVTVQGDIIPYPFEGPSWAWAGLTAR